MRDALPRGGLLARMLNAVVVVLGMCVLAAGCSKVPPEPLQLERNILTVDNRTSNDWANVEIWLNTYYRVTVRSIPAVSRFQAPLDTFVAGFGQRFDYRRTPINDLRLTAILPDGKPLEIKKEFESRGLADALRGRKK